MSVLGGRRGRGQRYPWLRITGFQPSLLSISGCLSLIPHLVNLRVMPDSSWSHTHTFNPLPVVHLTPALSPLYEHPSHHPVISLASHCSPQLYSSHSHLFSAIDVFRPLFRGCQPSAQNPIVAPQFPSSKNYIHTTSRRASQHPLPYLIRASEEAPLFPHRPPHPHPSICPGYTGFLPSFPKYQMYLSAWATISTIPQTGRLKRQKHIFLRFW